MIEGAARGSQRPGVEALSVATLVGRYPQIGGILRDLGLTITGTERSSLRYICEEAGVDPMSVVSLLQSPVSPSATVAVPQAGCLTLSGGRTKSGRPENGGVPLEIRAGEIVAIVGATGSGKSQLLSDIESEARGDSPSVRTITFDNQPPSSLDTRESAPRVALISQTMHYLLDISAGELLEAHLTCRGAQLDSQTVARVVRAACELCGEAFTADQRLVSLSGGQSRALMIADAVHVSRAPVVLVDEIENAGIDKVRAIELLMDARSISIMATHDPLIAVMAHRRVILRDGGIAGVVERSAAESALLERLRAQERDSAALRRRLREGLDLAGS